MDMKKILQALDGASSKPVEGSNDMKKFTRIVTEAATPHKVALPVQMAMQHYQKPKKEKLEEVSVFKTYVAVVEEELAQEQVARKQLIRQYSQQIAESVLRKGQEQSMSEMDKSQTPPGRDGGEKGGKEHYGKSITAKSMTKKAGKELGKAFSKAHKKEKEESVAEATKKPNATTRHLRQHPVSDKDVAKPVKKPEKKKPEQVVAEYGDTAKGQKMLTKVQKRAVDRVTSKKADTDPAYAKKNKDTADAAWERMTTKEETVKVPVTQKPRQGPLRPQTGAGKHQDKKKDQKQGKEKHKKPFYELADIDSLMQAVDESKKKTLKNSNPCWKGYKPVGTKKKNGKTVPNCVPAKGNKK